MMIIPTPLPHPPPAALPSFNLSWEQASALALAGVPIRREAWTQWLGYTTGIWRLLDRSLNPIEVITATDFEGADYLADDWTIDSIGTVRDVCVLPPPTPGDGFIPPAISLKAGIGGLTAILGSSSPHGSYQLQFWVNGSLIGITEATDESSTTIPASFTSGTNTLQVIATSRLPLPAWIGLSNAYISPGTTTLDTIPISFTSSYDGYGITPGSGAIELAATITNTWGFPVLATISGFVDDDISFNGSIYGPGQWFPYGPGTASGAHGFEAIFILLPGESVAVGCRNNYPASGGITATAVITTIT
jgi:hypothetical protein